MLRVREKYSEKVPKPQNLAGNPFKNQAKRRGGGGSQERRKEGKEGVCCAKVCNPKPAIELLDPVGVEDYQSTYRHLHH